ncbi:NUDIX domain-containing protein [Halobellus sp. GM3]|uniref:NUDIX domain-containing protein n=1 Tax=Halobellus sp. GM3 TaxID=3458410 RepID=UPI00403DE0E4
MTGDDDHLRATISQRGVLFAPSEKILVVRRSTDGGWELPGGRLDPYEDAPEGVHREIIEETGLDVHVRRPVHTASWRNDTDQGRFAVYYWCVVPDGLDVADDDPVTLSDEHIDHRWLPPATAADRLSDVQQRAVSIAAEVHRG